eukprot:TRINITY_DN2376_c0_g1_i4.p1 TRINITY_DN2376_c0_g1~~TRINITY_DN2376_c0_g1_i4.p1  ORF type:complete len:1396 (-),score=564.67 TRINITY_DN2376_c0_g1_i4:42-4229(-)
MDDYEKRTQEREQRREARKKEEAEMDKVIEQRARDRMLRAKAREEERKREQEEYERKKEERMRIRDLGTSEEPTPPSATPSAEPSKTEELLPKRNILKNSIFEDKEREERRLKIELKRQQLEKELLELKKQEEEAELRKKRREEGRNRGHLEGDAISSSGEHQDRTLEEEKRRKEQEDEERRRKETEEAEKRIAEEQEVERRRKHLEEEENRRKVHEEAERNSKELEAEKKRKDLEEADRKRKELEENERKRKELEEEKKRKDKEDMDRRKKEQEEAERKRKEQEAEKKRKELEEAERKRKEHEEAERKRKEHEEAEKKRKELEEAERKRKEHEEEERKKRELEAEKKRKDQEDLERKRKEQEAEKKRKEQEELDRKKKEQLLAAQKRNEELEAARKRKEAEDAEKKKKDLEDAERRRKELEAEKKRKDLEAAEKKRKEQEEAEKKRKEQEEEKKRKEQEELEKKRKIEEEKKRKEQEEAELKKKEQEIQQNTPQVIEIALETSASDIISLNLEINENPIELDDDELTRLAIAELEAEAKGKTIMEISIDPVPEVKEVKESIISVDLEPVPETKPVTLSPANTQYVADFKSKLTAALKGGPQPTSVSNPSTPLNKSNPSTAAPATAPLQHFKKPQIAGRQAPSRNPVARAETHRITEITTKPSADDPPPPRGVHRTFSEKSSPAVKKPPAGVRLGGLGGVIAEAFQVQDTSSAPGTPKGPLFDPNAVLKSAVVSPTRARKDKPRLIKIMGNRRIHAREVPLSVSYLSNGHVYVLDDMNTVWLWYGKKCHRQEKAAGLDIATRINRQVHGGRAPQTPITSGQEPDEFWTVIGKGTPQPPTNDEEEMSKFDENDQLFVFEPQDNEYIPITGKREQKQLNDTRSFILDCKDEFYVWHGKKVSKKDKDAANLKAEEMFDRNKDRASFCELRRENQGGESVLFVYKFASWEPEATLSGSIPTRGNIAASKEQTKMDVNKMHFAERPISGKKLLDNGKDGKIYIWSIEGFEKKTVPPEEFGQFYSAKSYVILYNFGNLERYHLYFWQGANSTVNEKGTAAGITMDINVKLCKNAASQERVPQYHEPPHFRLLFENKLIVHDGDRPEKLNENNNNIFKPALYHLRGSSPENTSTYQVALNSISLFSSDVFILATPKHFYIWHGKHSQAHPKKYALNLVNHIKGTAELTIVEELKEPKEFWDLLGGKKNYLNVPYKMEPKLFECKNDLSVFMCDRIYDFAQDDLQKTKLFILDTFNEVFLWVGEQSNSSWKPLAVEMVEEYIKTAKGRPPNLQGRTITPGKEPLEFGMVFHAFKFKNLPQAQAISDSPVISPSRSKERLASSLVIPFEQLKTKKNLPPEVNLLKLETYLSDQEFLKVLEMDREAWEKKPDWQKLEIRKKVGLY